MLQCVAVCFRDSSFEKVQGFFDRMQRSFGKSDCSLLQCRVGAGARVVVPTDVVEFKVRFTECTALLREYMALLIECRALLTEYAILCYRVESVLA